MRSSQRWPPRSRSPSRAGSERGCRSAGRAACRRHPNHSGVASAAGSAGTGDRRHRFALSRPDRRPSAPVPRRRRATNRCPTRCCSAPSRHEVRLHLPDLMATDGRARRSAGVRVGGRDQRRASPAASDAAALSATRLASRIPGLVVRSTSASDERAAPFVVLERFHLAIAIVTVIASSIFLLALMLMLVDERRETVGILRLIGFRRRRILLHVLAEGVVVAAAGARVRHRAVGRVRGRHQPSSSSGATTPRWSSCASHRGSRCGRLRCRRAARRRSRRSPRRGRCCGARCFC